MIYTLTENEDYKDFVNRALKGLVVDDLLSIFVFVLEVVATEKTVVECSMSVDKKAEEISVEIVHHGNAIKKNILDIIDDQVDYIHYSNQSKDSHRLKVRKTVHFINETR